MKGLGCYKPYLVFVETRQLSTCTEEDDITCVINRCVISMTDPLSQALIGARYVFYSLDCVWSNYVNRIRITCGACGNESAKFRYIRSVSLVVVWFDIICGCYSSTLFQVGVTTLSKGLYLDTYFYEAFNWSKTSLLAVRALVEEGEGKIC